MWIDRSSDRSTTPKQELRVAIVCRSIYLGHRLGWRVNRMTRIGRLRHLPWMAALLAPMLALPAAAAPVEITFTAHGVPHIRAGDFYGAGYGYGYAAAKIDLCSLATTFVDVDGRRAESFGADQTTSSPLSSRPVANVTADLVNHLLIDDAMLADQRAGLTPEARALVEGYAEGFNRYLADTPAAARPEA